MIIDEKWIYTVGLCVSFKCFFLLKIVPIEEEQIIADGIIARKISNQLEREKAVTIHVKHEENPPPYEEKDFKYPKDDKHHYFHKDHEHHKHHDGHKHHKHHNHHDHHKHNKDSEYDKHHKHEKKPKKFQGRPPNEELDPNGPEDKYHFVGIMFFILGLIHILPYTFFTTANEYWMYKFRNTSIEYSTDANDRTYLQANFSTLSHMITTIPSTICQFLLTFLGHKIRAKTRTLFTLVLHSLVFVLQTIFVTVNTDDWQVGFFCLTVGFMTMISCSMCLGSTGNMVTISQFPDQYLKKYLVGESVAALVTAIMRLISIVASPSTTASALIYFITGSVIMIIPTIFFYFSTKLEFFRYYTRNMKKATRKRVPRVSEFKEIIGYIWPLLILTVVALLIPHTSVNALVVSEYYGTDSIWGTKYFVTCCTYLLPAVCGILGRAIFYKFEYNPPIKVLYLAHLSRELVYTPLMLFVNAKPRNHLPVLFPHDWQYALIIGSQALVTGYTSNMASMKSLRMVSQEKLELSWLVQLFVIKLTSIATSPIGILVVSLL